MSKMGPIQVLADLLEVRGNVKVIHSMRVINPDMDGETVLPFQDVIIER